VASDPPSRATADGHPLNLRQLQYFSVIVEEGSFTRAAERLMVSQPSLSHQLKALEAAVGGLLLERLPRGVVPTPMGRALLPRAHEALAAVAAGRSDARRARDLDFAELTISTTLGIAYGLLPELLRSWSEGYPASRVLVIERKHTREVLADVEKGSTDAAISQLPLSDWTGPRESLGIEQMVLVTSPDDPRGDEDGEVDLTEFEADLWVLPSIDCGLAEPVAAACAAAGIEPRPAVRTLSSATAVRLAAAGVGPTLVPASSAPADATAKVLRPLPPFSRELVLYGRPGSESLIDSLASKARSIDLLPAGRPAA